MSEQSEKIQSDIDLELAIDCLIKRGFPTFDEFCKNPDKYRIAKEELFKSVDSSSQVFRNQIKGQKYIWKGDYPCASLEQVERIAKDEGFTIDQLEMRPGVRPINGTDPNGPMEILIQFWPKDEFKAMGGVVANA